MSYIRMLSLYPYQGSLESADLFGYTTKGVPGIEIIGLSKHGRQIKEKFVYLSKERGLKFPPLRFVLCVEGDVEGKKFKSEEYRFLELPLLIMLWKMADILPIYELTDCFAAGKVSVQGEVDYLNLKPKDQDSLFDKIGESSEGIPKMIAPKEMQINEKFGHIYLEDLLGVSFKEAHFADQKNYCSRT